MQMSVRVLGQFHVSGRMLKVTPLCCGTGLSLRWGKSSRILNSELRWDMEPHGQLIPTLLVLMLVTYICEAGMGNFSFLCFSYFTETFFCFVYELSLSDEEPLGLKRHLWWEREIKKWIYFYFWSYGVPTFPSFLW